MGHGCPGAILRQSAPRYHCCHGYAVCPAEGSSVGELIDFEQNGPFGGGSSGLGLVAAAELLQ